MSKKKNTVDLHLSQDNLDRLLATEKDFQSLKTTRADAYDEIQIAKCDQYATIISHIKPIFSTHKTPSNNLPRQIGIDTRETLMNEVGQSKANAKMLWETSVKFIAKYDADIPSQATPNSVLEVFESMGIKSQNDIKKSVSEDADIDVAEQIAKKLFVKTKKQKVKRDDNITEEQFMFLVNIMLTNCNRSGRNSKTIAEKDKSMIKHLLTVSKRLKKIMILLVAWKMPSQVSEYTK